MTEETTKKTDAKRLKPMKAAVFIVILLAATAAASAVMAIRVWKNARSGGLFSWNRSVMYSSGIDELLDTMEQYGLTELYQNVPSDCDTAIIEELIMKCSDKGIRVYLLAGEPEWALEQEGSSLIRVINRAADWNRAMPEGLRIAGVMSDIEPHILKDQDSARLMECFADGYAAAMAEAGKQELELIACIPYYFDDEGRRAGLERLVKDGCTGLAVMNYYRGSESEHILTEAELAKKYDRRIITIYELQEEGKYGLTDRNTYNSVGLDALYDNYGKLRRDYFPQRIDYALHSYEALLEMTERESRE